MPARIGIRDFNPRNPDGDTCRLGVFLDFQKADRTEHGSQPTWFLRHSWSYAYEDEIVPAFMLPGREARFRVFEGKHVLQVLTRVLAQI